MEKLSIYSDSQSIQASLGTFGQSFLPTENPNFSKLLRDLFQTGKKYPIFERSPKLQRHGQRGKLETQCWNNERVRGLSNPVGINHETTLSEPAEPRVSDQLVTSKPRSGPSSTRMPSVRAVCVIGIMMAKRSTILEPSWRSIDQPACSASNRNALMD